ncbi:hypothetical protein ZWY2020_033770 [Hordeum vulgare]|nr:hypothetical protein ZWY2020_033770 [Hordeum vulgare]
MANGGEEGNAVAPRGFWQRRGAVSSTPPSSARTTASPFTSSPTTVCVSDMARLYTDAFHSCYDDMIVSMVKEYFKFLNKYLATFDGSTDEADAIGAAKEEAAAAIIEFVKSADLYRVSSLQKLQGFCTGEVQSQV